MLANPERIACAFWLSRKKFFGPLHHLEWYGAALDRCYNSETDLLFSGFRVHGGSIPFCRNLRKSALLPLSTPLPRISYRLGKNRSASHQLLPFLTKSPDAIFCAPGSFSVHRKSSDSQRRRFIMNIGIDHGYSAVKTRHFSFPAGISAYSYEPYTLQNTGVRRAVFCLRHRQTANPSKQNRKPQLLSPDPRGHSERNQTAR